MDLEVSKQNLNLAKLNNEMLLNRMQKLVQTERKITHLILDCINEIENRKIHLQNGYGSMFALLTEHFGYSPSAAQRRIDGARLIKQLPQVAVKIETGEINLSQVSQLQKSVRVLQNETGQKVTAEVKEQIINKIANLNTQKTEVIIAQELNLPLPLLHEKVQNHKDESQSITLYFSKEEVDVLNQVKQLKSNAVGSLELKDLILYLAKRELAKFEPKCDTKNKAKLSKPELDILKKSTDSYNETTVHVKNSNSYAKTVIPVKNSNSYAETVSAQTEQLSKNNNFTTEAALKMLNRKAISRKIYNSILKPSSCCEYKDPVSQKICGSKVFLNVDHIQPRWAGGSNDISNLRTLCQNHNTYRYRKQSQIKTKTYTPTNRSS